MDFIIQNIWLVLLALMSGAMLVMPSFSERFSGIRQIGPQEAVRLFNHEDALILDVREDSEYRDGHVAQSRHIPLGQLKGQIEKLAGYKEKPVVALCRSGNRSRHACGMLHKAGFKNVYNLAGGIGAWDQAGLPKQR